MVTHSILIELAHTPIYSGNEKGGGVLLPLVFTVNLCISGHPMGSVRLVGFPILPCLNVLYGASEGDIRKSSFIQIFAGLGEQKQILSCNYGVNANLKL